MAAATFLCFTLHSKQYMLDPVFLEMSEHQSKKKMSFCVMTKLLWDRSSFIYYYTQKKNYLGSEKVHFLFLKVKMMTVIFYVYDHFS